LVRIANRYAVAVAAVAEDHLQLAPGPAAVEMRVAVIVVTALGPRA
jgi:hypothetical protein